MRVLFTVWPNPSHLFPLVPIARALEGAGHDVRIASHAALASATRAAGLTAIELGTPEPPLGPAFRQPRSIVDWMRRLTDHLALDDENDRELWAAFHEFMLPAIWDFLPSEASPQDPHPMLDDAVAVARHWRPDLVLWDPCFPVGAVAARATGAEHARLLWGLDYFGWVLDRFAERPGETNPLAITMRTAAERHGVEVDENLLLGSWTVDPTPASIRLSTSARTVPARWVPFTGSASVPEWLLAPPRRPRVAVSLGVSQRLAFEGGWDHVPDLVTALGRLDVDVVATLDAGQLASVDELPPNVHCVDYLPLTQVLPTCSAIVHHGGVGTFAAACAHGVPQLITDCDGDNGMNVATKNGKEISAFKHVESAVTAGAVDRRRAGAVLDVRRDGVEEMYTSIRDVLEDPAYREGAESLLTDLRATSTPNTVAALLESLTSAGRAA